MRIFISIIMATITFVVMSVSAMADVGGMPLPIGVGYTALTSEKTKGSFSGYSVNLFYFIRGTTLSSNAEKITNFSFVLPLGSFMNNIDQNGRADNNPYIMIGDNLGLTVDIAMGYGWHDDLATRLTTDSFVYGIEPGIVFSPTGIRDGKLLFRASYVSSVTKTDNYKGYIVSCDYTF